MKFVKDFFLPKEVIIAFNILDNAGETFHPEAFKIVKDYIKKILRASPKDFAKFIRNGGSEREWVYSRIANIAGDMAESGDYHIYRGILDSSNHGPHLLKMFDCSVDELAKIGAINQQRAETEKKGIRENIKMVG